MDYSIQLLEENRKYLERNIKQTNLLVTDMQSATLELNKLSDLKNAIKILKLKNRK